MLLSVAVLFVLPSLTQGVRNRQAYAGNVGYGIRIEDQQGDSGFFQGSLLGGVGAFPIFAVVMRPVQFDSTDDAGICTADQKVHALSSDFGELLQLVAIPRAQHKNLRHADLRKYGEGRDGFYEAFVKPLLAVIQESRSVDVLRPMSIGAGNPIVILGRINNDARFVVRPAMDGSVLRSLFSSGQQATDDSEQNPDCNQRRHEVFMMNARATNSTCVANGLKAMAIPSKEIVMSTSRSVPVSFKHIPNFRSSWDATQWLEVARYVDGEYTGSTFFEVVADLEMMFKTDFVMAIEALGRRLRLTGRFSFHIESFHEYLDEQLPMFTAHFEFENGVLQPDLFGYHVSRDSLSFIRH